MLVLGKDQVHKTKVKARDFSRTFFENISSDEVLVTPSSGEKKAENFKSMFWKQITIFENFDFCTFHSASDVVFKFMEKIVKRKTYHQVKHHWIHPGGGWNLENFVFDSRKSHVTNENGRGFHVKKIIKSLDPSRRLCNVMSNIKLKQHSRTNECLNKTKSLVSFKFDHDQCSLLTVHTFQFQTYFFCSVIFSLTLQVQWTNAWWIISWRLSLSSKL